MDQNKNSLLSSLRYSLDHEQDTILASKKVSEEILPNIFSVKAPLFPGTTLFSGFDENEEVFFFRLTRNGADYFSLGLLPFRFSFFTSTGDLSRKGERSIHWLIKEERIPANASVRGRSSNSLDFYIFLSDLSLEERISALARFLLPDPGKKVGDLFPLDDINSLGISQEEAIKKLSKQAKDMGFLLSFDDNYLQLERLNYE